MLASQIPAKVPTPFAELSTLVNSPVPLAPPGGGRISWQQGFTQINMIPLASGGVPPFGQDVNAVLQAISAWAWWQGAGGQVAYDAGLSAGIGGYPMGAYLQAANGLGWWLSTVDNNASNPDAGGAGWMFIPLELAYNGNPNGHVAGKAAVAASGPVPASPPSQLWDYANGAFWMCTFTGPATGGPGVQAAWVPLSVLIPVNPSVAGNTYNYTTADLGQLRVRTNGGGAMSDSLPTLGSVGGGWWVAIFNGDATARLTITAPGSTQLDEVVGGSLVLLPKQTCLIACDANGNFWIIVKPIPQNFAPEEVYVNTSGTYGPGSYIVDTSAGPVTFQLTATPQQGDNYGIRDMFGTFAANPCTIDPNGNSVLEQGGQVPLDVNWVRAFLAFKSGDWSQV